MVKNTTGGNKAKGQARKLTVQPVSSRLRVAREDGELYGKVKSMLGNGMCEVLCDDGKPRLCHIRGKFKGRGKRDNFMTRDSIILVGKREWEDDESKVIKGKTKLPNCDLLEVYKDGDIERIKTSVKIDWSLFVEENKSASAAEEVEFKENADDDEHREIMGNYEEGRSGIININDEEIDVDDI